MLSFDMKINEWHSVTGDGQSTGHNIQRGTHINIHQVIHLFQQLIY